ILDLVGNPASHFTPCCLPLRAQQVGNVFQYYDVSHPLPARARRLSRRIERSSGYRDIETGAGSDDLHLAGRASHAISFAQKVLYIGDYVSWEQVLQGIRATRRILVEPQQTARGAVGMKHTAGGVERKDTRGNILKDGLAMPRALLQLHIHVGQFTARCLEV